jgi:DNA gyrase subunit A
MGVTFVKLKSGDSVSVVARSIERAAEIDEAAAEAEAEVVEGAVEGAVEQASATIDVGADPVPSNDETDTDPAADSPTEES